MPRQLTLPVGLPDHATFGNYQIGDNYEAVNAARRLARGPERQVLLFGNAGTGKTHLLYAAQKEALTRRCTAGYFSLAEPAVMQRLSAFADHGELVCVDDLHCVAGDRRAETLLFNLIEHQRGLNGRTLLAARRSPAELVFCMPDLSSRLQDGASFRLRALTDEQKRQAMRARARGRGFDLSEDVVDYVMTRFPRDTAALFQLLDDIDRASLTLRRRITIRLIKEIEAARAAESA